MVPKLQCFNLLPPDIVLSFVSLVRVRDEGSNSSCCFRKRVALLGLSPRAHSLTFPRPVFIIASRFYPAMALAELQEKAVELPVAETKVALILIAFQSIGTRSGFLDTKKGSCRVPDASRPRQLPQIKPMITNEVILLLCQNS